MFAQEMDGTHLTVNVLASAPTIEMADAVYAELFPFFSSIREHEDDYKFLYESLPPWEPWTEKIRFYEWEQDESRLSHGVLSRVGTQIELRDLDFSLGYGLPGLLAYLRDKGCSSIEYSFSVA